MSGTILLEQGMRARERGYFYDISSSAFVEDVNERDYIINNYFGLVAKKVDEVKLNNVIGEIMTRYMKKDISSLIADIRTKMQPFISEPFKYYYVLDSGSVIAYFPGEFHYYFDRDFLLAISEPFKSQYKYILAKIIRAIGDTDLFTGFRSQLMKPDYIPELPYIIDEDKIDKIKKRLYALEKQSNPKLYFNVITNEFEEPAPGSYYLDEFSITSPMEDYKITDIINDVLSNDEDLVDVMEDYNIRRNIAFYEEGKQIFITSQWRDRLNELISKDDKHYYYNPVEDIFVRRNANTEDKYIFSEEFSLAYPNDIIKDVDIINSDIKAVRSNFVDLIPKLEAYRKGRSVV